MLSLLVTAIQNLARPAPSSPVRFSPPLTRLFAPPIANSLIENARLAFELNSRKQSPLQISNRKWMAISDSRADDQLSARHLSFVTDFSRPRWRLIANARLEFELNSRKQSPLQISNRKWMATFQFTFAASPPPMLSAPVLAIIESRMRGSL